MTEDIRDSQEIAERIEDDYTQYAISVITDRALPKIDGLKPVHRRLLYAMEQENISSHRSHRKSARIVGECMGKYHPHGDKSIYDALVGMAQPFTTRYPLVDGQGNFGNIDGDPPAAFRYTEARLTKLAEYGLRDIDKGIVPMVDTFDGENEEPTKLGTLIPYLLLNGSQGIAVAISTSLPPHNLNEVMDALIHRLKHPQCTFDKIMDYIQGPDFPTGGVIVNDREKIKDTYKNGSGRLKHRANYHVEKAASGKKNLVFTDIPVNTDKEKIIGEINELVKEKKLEGRTKSVITDLSDESAENDIRLVVELAQGEVEDNIADQLIDKTSLEKNFTCTFYYLDNNTNPQQTGIMEILDAFNEHAQEVLIEKYRYKRDEAKKKAKRLRALATVLEDKEKLSELIRGSDNKTAARKALRDEFDLTKNQADYVLRMNLVKLTNKETIDVQSDLDDVESNLEHYRDVIDNKSKRKEELIDEYKTIKKEFGDDRRTIIGQENAEVSVEDRTEVTMVVAGKNGELLRYSRSSWGRFSNKSVPVQIADITLAPTTGHVIVFTNDEQCYWISAAEIQTKKRHLNEHPGVKCSSDTKITGIVAVPDLESGALGFYQKNGKIRFSSIEEYDNPRPSGIRGYKTGDSELMTVEYLPNFDESAFFMMNSGRRIIHFPANEAGTSGRSAIGVKGMNLGDDEHIISARALPSVKDAQAIVVSENGKAKRVDCSEFRPQGRAGKGLVAGRNLKDEPIRYGSFAYEDERIFAIKNDNMRKIKQNQLPNLERQDATEKAGLEIEEGEHIITVREEIYD